MKRRWPAAMVLALLGAAAIALPGTAGGARVQVGKLVLRADGGFKPQALPRRRYAPIRFQGYGKITTTDGSIPPALQHVKLEFDRDGRLTTAGLPVCRPAQLKGASTNQARSRCRGAMVGVGQVGAAVGLGPFGRIDVRAPLTVFNGPRIDGHRTAIAHAQAPFPIFETYVIVAPIERRRGLYRYRTSLDIPPIAGGSGSLTYLGSRIGRFYRLRGKRRSYISARCSDNVLQTKGRFSFADGNVIYGSVFKFCRIR